MGFVRQEPPQKEAFLVYPWGGVYKAKADVFSGFKSDADPDVTDLLVRLIDQLPDAVEYERRILLRGIFDNVTFPAGNINYCIETDKDFVTLALRGWMRIANAVDKSLIGMSGNRMGLKLVGGRYYGNSANQTSGVEVRGLDLNWSSKPSTPSGAYDVEVENVAFMDWSHRAVSLYSTPGTNVCRLWNVRAAAGKTGFAAGHKPSAMYFRGLADSHIGGSLSQAASAWDEVVCDSVVDVWFEDIYGSGTGDNGDFGASWYVKRARRCWFINILSDWCLAHGMRFVDSDGGEPCEGNTILGPQITAHDTLPDNSFSGIRFEGHSRYNSVAGGFIGQKHPEIAGHSFKYALEEVAGSSCDYNVAGVIPCMHIQTALFNKVGANSDFSHLVGDIA